MAKRKIPAQGVKKPAGRKKTGKSPQSSPAPAPSPPVPTPVPKAMRPLAFPIVGIGASAGGLEALEAFLKATPADTGIGFVLVVHLDPKHVSILPDILQRYTTMPVLQIKDGMRVEPNHVYVIPPNKQLTILHGALQLLELSQPRSANLPIDSFLLALAQDQQQNAISIILSGTGTDGTLGVKAIKSEAGMVMAQDEESAKYEGMPTSAVSTGLVDYVLPPAEMPGPLVQYTRHATRKGAGQIADREGPPSNAMQKIFVVLRARTGHDFSLYKKNTICRRIERRMNVQQIDDLADYARYLQESEHEAGILFKELLISVTSFFRDPEAFDILKKNILPKLLAEKPDGYTVRVWVPGCASGEEAYSVAIVLHECMERLPRRFQIQIFGTDIDEDAIGLARGGLYSESIVDSVGPERMRRYFTKEDDGRYRVKKMIREMLVFAPQDVIKDPPFTKLDLICCRNLLIYLGSELQKKLLPTFHYGLKPGGILFLGPSETIGQMTDLFAAADKKWKLFRRQPSALAARPVLDFPPALPVPDLPGLEPTEAVQRAEDISALQLVETILRETDTPPCAIINDRCDVVYIHGRTGRFLEPAEGKTSVNLIEMARPELKAELAAAIREVAAHRREVVRRNLQVNLDGGPLLLDLTVKPILERTVARGLMMVLFEAPTGSDKAKRPKAGQAAPKSKSGPAQQLELELQNTRESLQTTIEELETSNEELKSTNEELQSTNEELQSTNEELETSKEELQSMNEESATVNAELQARIDELTNVTDDMRNLLDATEIATVFLDADLRVRRFTPRATDLIPLTAADVGRPIHHLATKLIGVDIAEFGGQVLKDLIVRESEVASREGNNYLMRVRPYRTTSNVIDGVVITFEDISLIKQAEEAQRLAVVVRDSNDAITLQDRTGKIVAWNNGARRMYGYTEAEALQMSISDLVPKAQKADALDLVKRVFHGEKIESLETRRVTKDGQTLAVWLTVTLVPGTEGKPEFLATTERDITGRLKT